MGHIVRQKETNETLRQNALETVKRLIVKVIKNWPDIVAQLMVTIVGFVAPLTKTASGNRLQQLAMGILALLIMEHSQQPEKAGSQLIPFPHLPQFAHSSRASTGVQETEPQTG